MELLDFFRRAPKEAHSLHGEGGERLLTRMLSTGTNADLPAPLDFNRLAEEGYRINPAIYACIRTLAQTVADPTLKALTVDEQERVKTDTIVSGDQLAQLLVKPNPSQDSFEFFEQLMTHLYFAGNAFMLKVRSASGAVVALEMIRPDIMGIVPGKTREEGRVAAYTVTVNGGTPHPIPADDIIHFKLPDALDEFWGLSPIFVLARYGDVDLQSAEFLRAYFLNKGIPAGILTFENPVAKPERERVRDLWKEQYNSLEGWHNIAVLDAKVNYQNIQTGIKDVDMDVITNQTETRICSTFGIPPILISALAGISHASFSNIEESRRLFWMQTATPLYTRLSKKLTNELAIKEFGVERRIVFDLTAVPALQENKAEIRKMGMQGWNSGLLTRDQSFDLLGLAQETTQGNLIKILPGTEFRPIEDQDNAADRDNTIPRGSDETQGLEPANEPAIPGGRPRPNPQEKHALEPVLEPAIEAAMQLAMEPFATGECPWPDDDPRCAMFDEALLDGDDNLVMGLLRLLPGEFEAKLSPVLRLYALQLCAGREDDFVPNVAPTLQKVFGRLDEAAVESQRMVLGSTKIVDNKQMLFKSHGLLPNQTAALMLAEVQFFNQDRTRDEVSTMLGNLRIAFMSRYTVSFAKEAAALIHRELEEQIELKDILGEENGEQ